MMVLQEELAALRRDIDRIDEGLAALLEKRVEIARRIGATKEGAPVFDPAREVSVLQHVQESCSAIPPTSVQAIWREIFALCRDVQRPLRVAALGPEGSFSAEAARRFLGAAPDLTFHHAIPEVFRHVGLGDADLGVVPIENSFEGAVLATLDAFSACPKGIRIQQEISLPVRHVLASRESSLDAVREVHSHPQALAQCRRWLDTHLPGAVLVSAESTSAAAERSKGLPGGAAICSDAARERHGLLLLAADMQERSDNMTRFWLIGRGTPHPSARDKTSLLFNVRHEPGALFHALEPLRRGRCNLTHIQSRPLPGNPFEYLFFVDVLGHEGEEPLTSALEEMGARCTFLRLLGSYPVLA